MLCSLATIEFFNSMCYLYAILSLITDSFLLVNERYANSFSPNNSLLSCITFTNSSIFNFKLPLFNYHTYYITIFRFTQFIPSKCKKDRLPCSLGNLSFIKYVITSSFICISMLSISLSLFIVIFETSRCISCFLCWLVLISKNTSLNLFITSFTISNGIGSPSASWRSCFNS